MEITQEQYQLIADAFPKPRGNVKITNLQALNGILYILENGGKWRRLPEEFGHWHTVYMRFSRWAKSGVLTRVFQRLQEEQLIDQAVLGSDSTTVKVHPDGTGALRKLGPQAIGRSRGGLTTKIHMVAADARTAIIYALSPGQDHDATHVPRSSTLFPQVKTMMLRTDGSSSKRWDDRRRSRKANNCNCSWSQTGPMKGTKHAN